MPNFFSLLFWISQCMIVSPSKPVGQSCESFSICYFLYRQVGDMFVMASHSYWWSWYEIENAHSPIRITPLYWDTSTRADQLVPIHFPYIFSATTYCLWREALLSLLERVVLQSPQSTWADYPASSVLFAKYDGCSVSVVFPGKPVTSPYWIGAFSFPFPVALTVVIPVTLQGIVPHLMPQSLPLLSSPFHRCSSPTLPQSRLNSRPFVSR